MGGVSKKLWICFKTTNFGCSHKTLTLESSSEATLLGPGSVHSSPTQLRSIFRLPGGESWGLHKWTWLGVDCGSSIQSHKAGRILSQRCKLLPILPHNYSCHSTKFQVLVPTPPGAFSSPIKLSSQIQLLGQPWQNLNHELMTPTLLSTTLHPSRPSEGPRPHHTHGQVDSSQQSYPPTTSLFSTRGLVRLVSWAWSLGQALHMQFFLLEPSDSYPSQQSLPGTCTRTRYLPIPPCKQAGDSEWCPKGKCPSPQTS